LRTAAKGGVRNVRLPLPLPPPDEPEPIPAPEPDECITDATGQLYSFACDSPNAFAWGEVVVDFFVAHPRTE